MSFKIEGNTFTYTGGPSSGTAKLLIYLADGTVLVGTDAWPNSPRKMRLVLHPEYLPSRVAEARYGLARDIRQDVGLVPTIGNILPWFPDKPAIGDRDIRILLTYGVWTNPTRVVTFAGPITKLEAR